MQAPAHPGSRTQGDSFRGSGVPGRIGIVSCVLVAWLERPSMRKVWCRAARKRTLSYQDSVATACGHYVIAPAGLKGEGAATCPDCRKKEEGS